jgi:hypothetical protein
MELWAILTTFSQLASLNSNENNKLTLSCNFTKNGAGYKENGWRP